jgi:FkbM family methyltransferase
MSASLADQPSRAEAEFLFHRGAEADIQSVFRFEDYPLNRIAAADMRRIIDIGAHCGAFSYLCARSYPAASILAFEPLTINYDLSVRNTAQFANVEVRKCGLSDHDGEMRIFYAPAWGFAASSSVKSHYHSEDFELVQVRRAAGQLEDAGPVGILKIDTEGHELRILRNLADRLADVSFIFLEVHDDADRMRIDSVLQADFHLFYARCDMVNRYKLSYVIRHHAGAGTVRVTAAPALSARI